MLELKELVTDYLAICNLDGTIIYRIAWKSRFDDRKGHGDYCLTLDQARRLVVLSNSKYPYINYWYESNVDFCGPLRNDFLSEDDFNLLFLSN